MAASVAFGYTLMLRRTSMRRFLSFVMASAILLAGVALTGFEIVRSDGVRPFVLFGALVMVVISGAWLLEEFVLSLWQRKT